tara:strand:- start:16281 stop:18233 length:1953 start_codon:yes stop_codon:yes gene_type:complete
MKINKIYFISVFLLSFFLILINFSDFSLGADEIIFYTIPAEAILDIKSPREFLEVITYGFFYEDHLSPLTNIFSPIILLFIENNFLVIINFFFFLIALFCFYFLAFEITQSKNTSIYLTLISSSNVYLNWYLATSNSSFLLSLILQILTILLFLKKVSFSKSVLLLIIVTLGTLTFENYFLAYIFCSAIWFYKLFNESKLDIKKILFFVKKNLVFPLILTIGLIPYLFLHYVKFGTYLPSSRLENSFSESIASFSLVTSKIINEILFGIPELLIYKKSMFLFTLVISLFLILSLVIFFKNDRYSFKGSNFLIFIGLLFCIFVAGLTGRYHIGLWSLIWFLLVLYSYSIFYKNLYSKKGLTSFYFSLPLIILFISSLNFYNSSFISGQKKIIDRSYFLDSGLSHLDNPEKNSSLYIDLTSDNSFHEIRYTLSKRAMNSKIPTAKIINPIYGSQPLGSSIKWVVSPNLNEKEFKYLLSEEKNIFFIFDNYLLIYEKKGNEKNININKWFGCYERQPSYKHSLDIEEEQIKKINSILKILNIENNHFKNLSSIKCLPSGYVKMLNFEFNELDKQNLKSYKNPCRLYVNFGNDFVNFLTFVGSENHIEIPKYDLYPIEFNSLSFHINSSDRRKKKLIALSEEESESHLKEICNL